MPVKWGLFAGLPLLDFPGRLIVPGQSRLRGRFNLKGRGSSLVTRNPSIATARLRLSHLRQVPSVTASWHFDIRPHYKHLSHHLHRFDRCYSRFTTNVLSLLVEISNIIPCLVCLLFLLSINNLLFFNVSFQIVTYSLFKYRPLKGLTDVSKSGLFSIF